MPVSEYSKDADRTTDVQTHDETPFSAFAGDHPKLLKGLTDCGYVTASPIQVAALPVVIAGNDTIVEAKNGTGKTLTFVVPTLMRLNAELSHLQSVVLAPTREIAVQIQQCFKKVGRHLPKLKCEYFIGGTPVEEDKLKASGCQIAVGSPGRIKHLLNEHVLKGSEVKSFILDEVDRLFSDKNFTKDVRLIDAKFPKIKQVIAVSASIDKKDMFLFDEFMQEYTMVKGSEEDMNASEDPSKFLLGIKQYVACVKAVSTNIILLPAKNVRLLNILQNLPYTQCIVFTNYMTRVEAVCNMLRDHEYKADYIRGDQDQNIRLELVDRLTSFKSKILVATDLIARGIDSSNVDLVINMDCPHDWPTYLHRIGRAGRFGNKGNAFTILDDDKELKLFKRIINSIENVKIKMLPIAIDKPILEYADNELKDLNLIIESGIENKTNGIEENKQDDNELKSNKIQSNASCPVVEYKPDTVNKSINVSNMSKEDSLQKLCRIVKETEKKLIDNNLVDKKFLTADRSFVLFDPEPLLNDIDEYAKYSPQELIEIMTKYDSDYERYEAEKKSVFDKHEFQNCKKELSNSNRVDLENDFSHEINRENYNVNTTLNTDQPTQSQTILQISSEEVELVHDTCSKDDLSNKLKNNNETEINIKTSQLRFTNVYDLFQLPDFSLLKTSSHNNPQNDSITEQSTNDNSMYEDTENVTENCEEESYLEDESWFDYEESEVEVELEEEENENDDDDDECITDYESEEESNGENIENRIYDRYEKCTNSSAKHGDKSVENNVQNCFHKSRPTQQIVGNETECNQQLVDYDILNDWYRQWKQQMSMIQTCVRTSK